MDKPTPETSLDPRKAEAPESEVASSGQIEDFKYKIGKSRQLFLIVLMSALILPMRSERGNKTESLLDRIFRQCNEMVLNSKKNMQDEEQIKQKVIECFQLALGREELIAEKREKDVQISKKMKPLLSVIPKSVQKRLKGFDAKKFNVLDEAFVVIDDNELDEDAKAAFRYLIFNDDGRLMSEPALVIILRDLNYYKSPNFLATILVHEIFGHGLNEELIKTESLMYDSDGYSIREFKKALELTSQRRHKSEIQAKYVDNTFVNWMIEQGYMEMEELNAKNDTFIAEFYHLYKEAMTSKNWSKFKIRIIARYELVDNFEFAVSQLPEEQKQGTYEELHERLIKIMEEVALKKYPNLITPEKPKVE
jgi:hypothetical protein